MNNNCTFKNFVTNGTNKEAFEKCNLAAQGIGKYCNPLWIHGVSGCGKSHLARAVCAYTQAAKELEAVRVTAEIAAEAMVSFLDGVPLNWEHLQASDILVIENIDFFCGREHSQAFLADMIAEKCKRGEQVIITSEYMPCLFKTLYGVFSGIPDKVEVRIGFPDEELCRAYISGYLKSQPLRLTVSAVKYLSQCRLNIAQLEGVLLAAKLWYERTSKKIGIAWMKEYTSDIKEDE